jgi:tRNA nucleotidyltransferase (CCA-adding enzyme)
MADIMSREGIQGERRAVFMLAALTHDLGKAVSTRWNEEKQKWTAYGHDVSGVPLAHRFLESIGTFPENIPQILSLVRWHMAHTRKDFTAKAVAKLARELYPATIADLMFVLEADCAGRPPIPPGLPAAVTEQLVPIAKENGWYTDVPKDSRYLLRQGRSGVLSCER